MTDAAAEIVKLRSVCRDAELWTEGGQPVAFLPGLTITKAGKGSMQVDALLWPHMRDGYMTRLYLSQQIPWSIGGQWTCCVIQGRTWHICSWNNVPASLPWIEILANHLRAFQ